MQPLIPRPPLPEARKEAELDTKYQVWVAKLTPAQQAWERTLQAELGSFYLPIWLGDGKWDVIHFNFGIHDRATGLGNQFLGEQVAKFLKSMIPIVPKPGK